MWYSGSGDTPPVAWPAGTVPARDKPGYAIYNTDYTGNIWRTDGGLGSGRGLPLSWVGTRGTTLHMKLPRLTVAFDTRAEPLRNRVPACDEDGKPLSDFMMLIPGLRDKPKHLINAAIQDVHIALTHFSHAVVFAEFNLRLNLLWVSIRPIHGIRFEIASAIQRHVPEAKLVSHI